MRSILPPSTVWVATPATGSAGTMPPVRRWEEGISALVIRDSRTSLDWGAVETMILT